MVERCRLQGHSQVTTRHRGGLQLACRAQWRGEAMYCAALQRKAAASPDFAGQEPASRPSCTTRSKSHSEAPPGSRTHTEVGHRLLEGLGLFLSELWQDVTHCCPHGGRVFTKVAGVCPQPQVEVNVALGSCLQGAGCCLCL